MTVSTHLSYIPGLDGIRALAVMAVLCYHANYAWALGGFLGVETFFVLSGFLITSLLLAEWQSTKAIDLRHFWVRRARRRRERVVRDHHPPRRRHRPLLDLEDRPRPRAPSRRRGNRDRVSIAHAYRSGTQRRSTLARQIRRPVRRLQGPRPRRKAARRLAPRQPRARPAPGCARLCGDGAYVRVAAPALSGSASWAW